MWMFSIPIPNHAMQMQITVEKYVKQHLRSYLHERLIVPLSQQFIIYSFYSPFLYQYKMAEN